MSCVSSLNTINVDRNSAGCEHPTIEDVLDGCVDTSFRITIDVKTLSYRYKGLRSSNLKWTTIENVQL